MPRVFCCKFFIFLKIFTKYEERIFADDLMQKNYSYFLTEPIGKNFHQDFKPDLSPKDMLSLGIFGGKYMIDCKNEFPEDLV